MSRKIAITGSSGLIGQEMTSFFRTKGDAVTPVIRQSGGDHSETAVCWDIDSGFIEHEKLEGYDAVIHLAGANIANRRWTNVYKKIILDSRIQSTTLLVKTLVNLRNPPKVLFSASAVGYYGAHDPAKIVDEQTAVGHDFLADVCRQWEEATQPAQAKGVRVVCLRFGMVLSGQGGALAKMLPAFRLGLAGKLGSGRQIISWISLKEIPLIVEHLISQKDISGTVNVVSPQPVSNEEFTQTMGKILRRPTFLPAPGFALRLLLGEMAESLLLSGAKVMPERLLKSGYQFQYPDLESALRISLEE